jgi:hypothetical protein
VVCITACKLFTNTKASSLNQPRATHRIAALSSHVCGFVLQLANQSTESPILDASFWSENGVSCSHERNKIGDSVICCKLFTNTKASSLNQPRATHRIAALSSHVCGFVLQLANFLQIQKHHHSTNR